MESPEFISLFFHFIALTLIVPTEQLNLVFYSLVGINTIK